VKVRSKALWWGLVLGLIVVLIGIWVIFRDEPMWGLLFTIVVLVFFALLICLPLAKAISEALMDKLFAVNKGKVAKDYSKARWLVTQERFEEAIEEFRRDLEEEPENIALRMEIAEILSRDMEDFHQAISEMEECLNFPVGEAQAASILNRIADIHETNLGDPRTAIAALSRIAQDRPGTKAAARAYQRIEAIRAAMPNRAEG
jgi:tetratricopeptide (TPR) repeat protein